MTSIVRQGCFSSVVLHKAGGVSFPVLQHARAHHICAPQQVYMDPKRLLAYINLQLMCYAMLRCAGPG
jgi:hypothetical protein